MKSGRQVISEHRLTRYNGAHIFDGAGTNFGPVSLLVRHALDGQAGRVHSELLAIGTPVQIDAHPDAAEAHVVDRTDCVFLPGLVNAHTHLDLTHIGPQPHPGAEPSEAGAPGSAHDHSGFVEWVDLIRSRRETAEDAIRDSIQRGVELSLAGGIVAVGDICGAPGGVPTLVGWETLRASGLHGVSFLEFFAHGRFEQDSLERLRSVVSRYEAEHDEDSAVRFGLQPHAPYSVSLRAYGVAIDLAAGRLPLCTHLAETPEEREFVARATGPQRALMERLGAWDPSMLDAARSEEERMAGDRGIGAERHPVEHLAERLEQTPFLVAHVNDAPDDMIRILVETGTRIAYCPRASAYFGAASHFGDHRYREMIDAGLVVSLGTDSIVNLPGESARPESGGITTLDEARFLYQRDRTDPELLVRMATINGAICLGLEPSHFHFDAARPGRRLAGLVAVRVEDGASAIETVLNESVPPELLFGGNMYA